MNNNFKKIGSSKILPPEDEIKIKDLIDTKIEHYYISYSEGSCDLETFLSDVATILRKSPSPILLFDRTISMLKDKKETLRNLADNSSRFIRQGIQIMLDIICRYKCSKENLHNLLDLSQASSLLKKGDIFNLFNIWEMCIYSHRLDDFYKLAKTPGVKSKLVFILLEAKLKEPSTSWHKRDENQKLVKVFIEAGSHHNSRIKQYRKDITLFDNLLTDLLSDAENEQKWDSIHTVIARVRKVQTYYKIKRSDLETSQVLSWARTISDYIAIRLDKHRQMLPMKYIDFKYCSTKKFSILDMREIDDDYATLSDLVDLLQQVIKMKGDYYDNKEISSKIKKHQKDLQQLAGVRRRIKREQEIDARKYKVSRLLRDFKCALTNNHKKAIENADKAICEWYFPLSSAGLKKDLAYLKQKKLALSVKYLYQYSQSLKENIISLIYLNSPSNSQDVPSGNLKLAVAQYNKLNSTVLEYLKNSATEAKNDDGDEFQPKVLVKSMQLQINETISKKIDYIKGCYENDLTLKGRAKIFRKLNRLFAVVHEEQNTAITPAIKTKFDGLYKQIETFIIKKIKERKESIESKVNPVMESSGWREKSRNKNILWQGKALKSQCDKEINDLDSLNLDHTSPPIEQLVKDIRKIPSQITTRATKEQMALYTDLDTQYKECRDLLKKTSIKNSSKELDLTKQDNMTAPQDSFTQKLEAIATSLRYVIKNCPKDQIEIIKHQLSVTNSEMGRNENIFFNSHRQLRSEFKKYPELSLCFYFMQIVQLNKHSSVVGGLFWRYKRRNFLHEIFNALEEPDSKTRINKLISLYTKAHNYYSCKILDLQTTQETLKNILVNLLLINGIGDDLGLLEHAINQIYSECKRNVKYYSASQDLLAGMKEIYQNNNDLTLKTNQINAFIKMNESKIDNPILSPIKQSPPSLLSSHNIFTTNTTNEGENNTGPKQTHDYSGYEQTLNTPEGDGETIMTFENNTMG